MKYLLIALLAVFFAPRQDEEFDTLIVNGTVYDGTGRAGQQVDLAIKGDKIIKIGKLADAKAKKTIDASGLVVAPGFIDLHTHSDSPILAEGTRDNLNYLLQGCTLIVTGNCGSGHVDVGEFYEKIDKNGAGSNVCHLIPHGSVRQRVFGNANRAPTDKELQKMRELVEQAMKDGACGMSTGLIYTPGTYAKTEEIGELAKVVGKYGGFYASHIRGEGVELVQSVEEAIEIGRIGGCPVHVSHFKASGKNAWGKIQDAAAKIEAARKAGMKVTADQYPYTASSTSLAAYLVPTELREGSEKQMIERLDDPKVTEHIKKLFENRLAPDKIMIASFSKDPGYNGKTLAQIAEKEKKTPLEAGIDILRRGGAQGIFFAMNEDDVRWAMQRTWVATASDGGAKKPDKTNPHPRSYGTFSRKIGYYSIELGVLPLEQAICSSSGLPAEIMGLKDRGLLREGYFADVVVFDPKTFRDKATFEKPHQYSEGMRYVWVNGVLTIDAGKHTGALAGRAIRHKK